MVLSAKAEGDMRASGWLLGVAAVGAIAGMVGAGCGGSSQESPTDAGADVTKDQGAPDTGMPEAAMEAAAMDSGMACAVDASLESLMVPDAAIGDSGATAPGCVACIEANCSPQLMACDNDCACKTAIVGFLGCAATSPNPISCAGMFTGADTTAQGLGLCAYGGCQKPCGFPSFSGGDGGMGDGGDAATTDAAAADAAAD